MDNSHYLQEEEVEEEVEEILEKVEKKMEEVEEIGKLIILLDSLYLMKKHMPQ